MLSSFPQNPSDRLLTIQEVSRQLDVSKHTLRFWEKELDGIIVPQRTKGGQRRYGSEHLTIIEEIKRLKKSGMSLLAIKRRFDNDQKDDVPGSLSNEIDELADKVAEVVKSAIHRYFEQEKYGTSVTSDE